MLFCTRIATARVGCPLRFVTCARSISNGAQGIFETFGNDKVTKLLHQMQWHARWQPNLHPDLPAHCTAFHQARVRACERQIEACGYDIAPAFMSRMLQDAQWGARLQRVQAGLHLHQQ